MSAKFQKGKVFFEITKDEFLKFLGLKEEDLTKEEIGEHIQFWMYPYSNGTPATYCYDNDNNCIRMYRDRRVLGDNCIVVKKFIYRKVRCKKTGEIYRDGRYSPSHWLIWKRFIDN